jgi:hypothetical protein
MQWTNPSTVGLFKIMAQVDYFDISLTNSIRGVLENDQINAGLIKRRLTIETCELKRIHEAFFQNLLKKFIKVISIELTDQSDVFERLPKPPP